jgi:hypothetical protein
MRENLARPDQGLTVNGDDGIILRHWQNGGDPGLWILAEFKTNGAQLGWADKQTLNAVRSPQYKLFGCSIEIDGDVPTALEHWPADRSTPRPSTTCTVKIWRPNGRIVPYRVAPGQLAGWLHDALGVAR